MIKFTPVFLWKVLLCVAATDTEGPFTHIQSIKTRGAAGFEYFNIDGVDYVACANFFTSKGSRAGSSQQPSMNTKSVIYRIKSVSNSTRLRLHVVQRIPTTGTYFVCIIHSPNI